MSVAGGSGDTAMAAVIAYLREQRGVDFSGYRPTTLGRRVQQAMARADVTALDEYLDHLQANPSSLDDLLDTLLINVTSFFRDPEVWQELQTVVLPSILERNPGRAVRIWSAGCATGEEAYTLAMVFAEVAGRDALRDRVKIYATDIDTLALAVARAAVYPARALDEIPARLRDAYLEPVEADRRRVRADLRRAVVFGRNDIVQDAPISRIDLLVCRNTLMYFTAETQARILDRLHFATTQGGVLMLGRAETALGHQGLFSPLDGRRRFFLKEELAAGEPRRGLDLTSVGAAEAGSELDRLHAEAMRETPYAHVVVSRSGRVTFVNRRASETLPVSDKDLGRLVQDTDISYRPVDLRSLLMQVRTELRPAGVRDVRWTRPNGEELIVDIVARPLTEPDGSYLGCGVTFLDVTGAHRLATDLEDVRQRLHASFQDVQSTTEELETTNEELQSTVEELETTNEELQSTNEELETTNEELRAVNEELFARGVEEQALTAQAEDLNRILDTVMDGIGAGVIVVDADLRIVVWTRTSQELWGLRADEVIGQPLESLDMGVDPARLAGLARTLLRNVPSTGAGSVSVPAEPGREPELQSQRVEAVDRRGRSITVRLTAQPVVLHDGRARVVLTVEGEAKGRASRRPHQQLSSAPGPGTEDGQA